MASKWDVYEQRLWKDSPPEGEGWTPIGCYGVVQHNGLRESLGGGYENYGVVVWVLKESPYTLTKPGSAKHPKV